MAHGPSQVDTAGQRIAGFVRRGTRVALSSIIVDELITAGGRETRLSAADAFHEYEREIALMRADVVRALVDEGGLSLTDVAKLLKISRQATARLYEQGWRGDESPH